MKNNYQPHIGAKNGAVSKIVLLPGDPARALIIAKFLKNVRKVAQNREFTTYRGLYKNVDVTVTSTGIGCPSAAIAVEELANIGAKIFIRVGTCGGINPKMKNGDLVIPSSVLAEDGTTKEYYGKKTKIRPSLKVFSALTEAAKQNKNNFFTGKNRTHDTFYESTENFLKYKNRKIDSSEMECSAIFAVAKLRNLEAAAILTVNTLEPFKEIKKNPEAVYRLASKSAVAKGVENSIITALDACVLLRRNFIV